MADPITAALAWAASAGAAGGTAAAAGGTAAAATVGGSVFTLGNAATAAAIGGSVYGGVQQAKAGAAFAQSAKLQRQAQDLQTARQRSDAIRQARMSMADATQAGANQGSLNSSSSQGGRASIQSQLASNLSFLDNYSSLTNRAGLAESAGNQYNINAQMGSAIGSLGFQAAGWAGSQQGKATMQKIGGIFRPRGT